MTEAQPTPFETRLRPISRAIDVALGISAIVKSSVTLKLPGNPFGIILPVGRDVDCRARFERNLHQVTKPLVDDAPFVMTFLVPGIGEE